MKNIQLRLALSFTLLFLLIALLVVRAYFLPQSAAADTPPTIYLSSTVHRANGTVEPTVYATYGASSLPQAPVGTLPIYQFKK